MKNGMLMQERLDLLRIVIPPTGIVHVGAGTGTVIAHYESWDVPTAVFIEAEESQFDKLSAAIGGKPGWTAHLALVSNQQAELGYYIASNPRESGLIPPEHLTGLWRNLKTSAKQLRQTITLESLMATEVNAACPLNWLIIDCLSAVPILEGSDLDTWDVILARVILDAEQYPGRGATKAEVDELLEARGYRYVICEEERHPSLGSALYIRDRKSKVVQLHQQLDQAKARLAERRKELDQAEASEEKLAFELQHKVEQLRQVRDEQVHLHQGYLEQVESVSHEKQALEKTHAVLQDQFVEQQRQIQYWHEEADKRQQEGEERRKRIEQLEQQLTEQDHRQRLLDEEILKAEAQLELIKDILLREKAF